MNNSFSWNAVPGAVKYIVELTNTSTQEKYKYETTETSMTFAVPAGTYEIVVKAEFADGREGIVIEDLINL